MNIPEKLTEIYLEKENWHNHKLSKEESNKYHERLLMQGNILTYISNDELIGYVEVWRINFEQFGRLVCNQPVFTDVEDIVTGNIALINNIYINESHRKGEAFRILLQMYLDKHKDADFYVTFRRLVRNQPILVYTRDEVNKFFNK